MAKGTVHQYFASKAELLRQAAMAEKASFVSTFLNIMDDPDPRKRLRCYVLETIRYLPQAPASVRFTETGSDFELYQRFDQLTVIQFLLVIEVTRSGSFAKKFQASWHLSRMSP